MLTHKQTHCTLSRAIMFRNLAGGHAISSARDSLAGVVGSYNGQAVFKAGISCGDLQLCENCLPVQKLLATYLIYHLPIILGTIYPRKIPDLFYYGAHTCYMSILDSAQN